MGSTRLRVLAVAALAAATIGVNYSGGVSRAAPASATDESKVPHYFGPYPNWANSPFTLADATVTISGDGAGAAATATVGAGGTVTGITVTNPGSGYTTATVTITGNGTGATATPVLTASPLKAVNVTASGAGYTTPTVTITGGGATTEATASAFGSVDSIAVTNVGNAYTFPTVEIGLPNDPLGVRATAHVDCVEAQCAPVAPATTVTITGVTIDNPGSGYSSAPSVTILDGTVASPATHDPAWAEALAASTVNVVSVTLDSFGDGYTSVPTVTITDATGSGIGAAATAVLGSGGVTAIDLVSGGTGYVTTGGIKKFQDGLPQLCVPQDGQTYASCASNNLGQHIPVAVPDTTTFPGADYYVIAVVQHRERMSSSLPASGTLLREYVQLETPANAATSKHVPLMTDLLDGTSVPTLLPNGTQAFAVDDPHYLGPVISATKDRAARVTFYDLLPTGAAGDLFLPTDSTMMGSGMGPMAMTDPADQGTVTDLVRNPECSEFPKPAGCFKDDRATLHLHGGTTPWISDGTPHQWITPAGENTPWPQGVSVAEVPDMVGAARPAGVPDCSAANDGCQTFYYTNEQSARLLFYHDHSWGITRLNVYAGEAAGYVISDPTEKKLISDGTIPADQIPLIIQDRTFVPSTGAIAQQDPTWDATRWGGEGNLWYHHVYMPAQNPGDPSGMSAYGRWMYGPWFWPPALNTVHGPIANPYYDPNCNLDDPSTWQYQTDPFCEPAQIPGTPNISAGMEQFNDTPVVNGTAYPTTTVDPKSYRMRILNAANDRFWNLQWYVADSTGTEVALNAADLAAAQTDPNVFPRPDTTLSPEGPQWVQIGTEGGFLPAPVVVPNQPIKWITDPTRFDFGNVDQHALLLAPAERADVVVDFSKYAGKTLILYNDAPAAFPARIPSYDYYTGAPDLSPAGSPGTLPGYGPNTRTIMQVKVAATAPAPAFDMAKLQAAFAHHADGSGVFESGQHPIIVGQAAYNSAYGTNFVTAGNCNVPNSTVTRCDGYVRINQQGGDTFKFNTLVTGTTATLGIPLEPKAIHDEMNATAFDEFGRMQANLGVEAVPATPAAQNVTLYPYVNPMTELIDATNLPKGDVNVTPITTADGTQLWKITHNGVDTHPIHFHLFDVQIVNRVTWDNIIIPPDANELGWKDTVRVSPLEDTIVALRPIIPTTPFEVPNSVRELNPMMLDGATAGFNNIDPNGNPTATIVNKLVNFGWEFVYHCHILSHEEMDMMRPVSVAVPPLKPTITGSTTSGNGANRRVVLNWNDNSITETSFTVQRTTNGTTWVDVGTVPVPLNQPNVHQARTFTDPTSNTTTPYLYRIVANNTVGYGAEFPTVTARSTSDTFPVNVTVPAAPTGLTAVPAATGTGVTVTWTDNATNETGFTVQRADVTNGVTGAFTTAGTVAARTGTGAVTFVDRNVSASAVYAYRVMVTNLAGSALSNVATVTMPALPPAPGGVSASAARSGNGEVITVRWTDVLGETGYTVQWSTTSAFTTVAGSTTAAANAVTVATPRIARQAWFVRVGAGNAAGTTWSTPVQVPSA